jgi:integrase
MARSSLIRAIRYAEANDLVGRNVAALVTQPKGLEGHPSKSLTVPQAQALISASERSRLHVYIVLCLLTGCRTEEARALRWDHVDVHVILMSSRRSRRMWPYGDRCARTVM